MRTKSDLWIHPETHPRARLPYLLQVDEILRQSPSAGAPPSGPMMVSYPSPAGAPAMVPVMAGPMGPGGPMLAGGPPMPMMQGQHYMMQQPMVRRTLPHRLHSPCANQRASPPSQMLVAANPSASMGPPYGEPVMVAPNGAVPYPPNGMPPNGAAPSPPRPPAGPAPSGPGGPPY